MMNKIEMSEIADLTGAISNYNKLASYLPQLDNTQRESLNVLWQRALKFSRGGKYMDPEAYTHWQFINLHMVSQMWGSTSCGWGGIGGAAMTSSYTTIIENSYLNAVFVYYGPTLVYISDDNEKLEKYKTNGWKSLPSMDSAKKQLDLFYIKTKR